MTDDSTSAPDNGARPGAAESSAASSTRPAGGGGAGWTKSPSIWPEPITPAKRPDLWSPEARRTGPLPTVTTPLAAQSAGDSPGQDPAGTQPDGADSAEPKRPAGESAEPKRPGEEAAGPARDQAGPEGEQTAPSPAGSPDDALSYTGLFKTISDNDLADAGQSPQPGGPGTPPAADHGADHESGSGAPDPGTQKSADRVAEEPPSDDRVTVAAAAAASGDSDSGDTGSGDSGSGDTDPGDSDSGDTDSGDTDPANDDPGAASTESGDATVTFDVASELDAEEQNEQDRDNARSVRKPAAGATAGIAASIIAESGGPAAQTPRPEPESARADGPEDVDSGAPAQDRPAVRDSHDVPHSILAASAPDPVASSAGAPVAGAAAGAPVRSVSAARAERQGTRPSDDGGPATTVWAATDAGAAAAGGAVLAGVPGGSTGGSSGGAAAGGAAAGGAAAGGTGGDGGSGDGGGEDAARDAGRAGGGRSGASTGRRRILIGAGVVVGLLAIGYGVAYAVAGNSLARGATVAGIEVGGMTRDEAAGVLAEQLPGVVDAPIAVTVDGDEATYELVPSSIGLSVDIHATLDAVPGASANPVSLVRALLGSGETTPVVSADEDAITAAVADIASQSDTEPVNGSVAFDGGDIVTSEPVAGRALDTEAAVAALTAAYYGGDSPGTTPERAVTFPSAVVEPAVGADDVEAAVAEFAEPAMSGPVTVVADGESVDLSPALISKALTMTADDSGVLQPVLDPKALAEAAAEELEELGQQGKDATVVIENGKPVVVEAEAGLAIAPEALSEAVLPVLSLAGDERSVEVELTESDPEVTTEAAQELGIVEVVSEFTTHFPPAHYRDVNIGTAAERIDNTLLMPGDEFSLNGIVGERTAANGFTSGTIIDGGRLKEDMGGGVSQVATTTFHAAFKAGLEDVEHWPHSIYFDRYPIGQEATVAWGSKDMRFRNDTPYGVLVDTSFTPSAGRGKGTLTVRIWSTKYYDVSTSVGDRYAFTSPQTIYDTGGNCSAQGGSQGFTIDSYRTVKLLDGTVDKDEHTSWTYNPNHKVVCGPEPGDGGGGRNDN